MSVILFMKLVFRDMGLNTVLPVNILKLIYKLRLYENHLKGHFLWTSIKDLWMK